MQVEPTKSLNVIKKPSRTVAPAKKLKPVIRKAPRPVIREAEPEIKRVSPGLAKPKPKAVVKLKPKVKIKAEPIQSPQKIRKFLNQYVPPRHCDSCVLSSKCPLYLPGKICGFTELIDSKSVDGPKDVGEVHLKLIELMEQRIQFATIAEQLSGDVADDNVNKMITTLSFIIRDYNNDKKQIGTPVIITKNDNDTNNKPNIVQFLFGNMMQNIPERPTVQHAPSMELSDLDEVRVNYLENRKSDKVTQFLEGKDRDNGSD